MTNIEVGADHAGFELKEYIKELLASKGFSVSDHGTHSEVSTDYPEYAHATARAVVENGSLGILICGSANGVCMTANKHKGVRAAICWEEEIAVLARKHNDANIICIPARFVTKELAWAMIEVFVSTAFEGGRHETRVNKINC